MRRSFRRTTPGSSSSRHDATIAAATVVVVVVVDDAASASPPRPSRRSDSIHSTSDRPSSGMHSTWTDPTWRRPFRRNASDSRMGARTSRS